MKRHQQNFLAGRPMALVTLLISLPILGQVGIGTTNPNPNSVLDVTSTVAAPGGILLPRVELGSSSIAGPLTNHVEGMIVYNTANTADVYPGIYISNGSRWIRTEDLSPASVSQSLSGDIEISANSYAAVPGINDLTFTARKTEVLVLLTASGFAYTNSMAYVQFRVWNSTDADSVGGTSTKMQSYDDITGTVTAWSASFSKVLTGLSIGTSYTLQVQAQVAGIYGTPNAGVFESSNPDNHHLTLSVMH